MDRVAIILPRATTRAPRASSDNDDIINVTRLEHPPLTRLLPRLTTSLALTLLASKPSGLTPLSPRARII
jgi:hypothetical protein